MAVRSIMFTISLAALPFTGGWLHAQEADKPYYVQTAQLVVAKVKGTNEFLAYSKTVGKWNAFTFPEGVTAVPVVSNGLVAFQLEGEAITEIVAVDRKGKWCRSKLAAPNKLCVPIIADQVAICVVNGIAHAFSGERGKWDSVATSVAPQLTDDTAMILAPDSIAVFSAATGKWAVAKLTAE